MTQPALDDSVLQETITLPFEQVGQAIATTVEEALLQLDERAEQWSPEARAALALGVVNIDIEFGGDNDERSDGLES